jgi:serpin B
MLNDPLQALGMRRPFDPVGADFTRMSAPGGLFISKVKQKAFVDVHEEGTEAAAVTSVQIDLTSAGPAIRIDRPFVFAIRERLSGTILFLGKIVRPPA